MAIRKKKADTAAPETLAVVQTGTHSHPFYTLASYTPGTPAEFALYRSLREAVPIIDAAISKLVRLLGTFQVNCETASAQTALARFLETVNVGGTRQGIQSFLSTFFEQLLTYGTAVGEMALTNGTLTHLYNADLSAVRLCADENPLDVSVCVWNEKGQLTPVPYPQLILKSVHNPEPGRIYGTSLLRGLPFVSDVLLKIINTIGLNWERVGNVRFAVTYNPPNDIVDKAYTKERAAVVADAWRDAMSGSGAVKDFVAVGDVSIKAIGADNQILDSDVPVRQMLEQIVAKLGIPPFLLGLSWSSTERMSTQQADILTSEIDFYRRELNPVIHRICETFLRLAGYPTDVQIEWNDLTLQDITELSRSAYYDAQTKRILNDIDKGGPTA